MTTDMTHLIFVSPDKPIWLTPYEGVDPKNPWFSWPIDDGKPALKFEQPQELLDWLICSPWRAKLEVLLQSNAQDEEGFPLLCSFLDIDVWRALVADASGQPFGHILAKALDEWLALGAGWVGFTGYVHGGVPDGAEHELASAEYTSV